MDGWNTSFLLGWPIFRGYVSFRECTFLWPQSAKKFCKSSFLACCQATYQIWWIWFNFLSCANSLSFGFSFQFIDWNVFSPQSHKIASPKNPSFYGFQQICPCFNHFRQRVRPAKGSLRKLSSFRMCLSCERLLGGCAAPVVFTPKVQPQGFTKLEGLWIRIWCVAHTLLFFILSVFVNVCVYNCIYIYI